MKGKGDIDYWALREWGVRATTALKMVGMVWTNIKEEEDVSKSK